MSQPLISRTKPPSDDDALVETSVLEDASLSFKAHGLYCFVCLCRQPDGTIDFSKVDIDKILKTSPDGYDAVASGLEELHAKGLFVWPPIKNFVYLAKSQWTGFHKIGKTRDRYVGRRIHSLQTVDPSIVLVFKIEAGRKLEKLLHFEFRESWVGGEWFDLDETALDRAKLLMADFR